MFGRPRDCKQLFEPDKGLEKQGELAGYFSLVL